MLSRQQKCYLYQSRQHWQTLNISIWQKIHLKYNYFSPLISFLQIVTVNITPTRKVLNSTSTPTQKILGKKSPQKVLNLQGFKSNKVQQKKTPNKREYSVTREDMSTPKKNESTVIREEIVSITKLRADAIKKDQEARKEVHDLEVSLLNKKYAHLCEKHKLTIKLMEQEYNNAVLRSSLIKKQLRELENLE